jgi:hypothetical protein
VNEAIKLDRQNSHHFLIKALYFFLLARIPEAIDAAQRSRVLAPKAISAPNFSLAFLYNFNGNFKKSRMEYMRALGKKTSYDPEMLRNILDFIRQAIVRFPEKPQLQFAFGFLHINRGDPQKGRQEIATFLNKATHQPSLSDFLAESRRILGQ